MTGFRLLALLALCGPAVAEEARLIALRSSLVAMKAIPPDSAGPRGAAPQLTVAKHQLRDWIETRLELLTRTGDEGEIERKLNSQLRESKLLCGIEVPELQPCYLNGIQFRRSGGFLILKTGVLIECGFDESAYIYVWSEEGWRRAWQNEQNTYTERGYQPQTIHAVRVSAYNKSNDYVVLTLGSRSWCSSNWQEVYYRAFRLGPDPEAAPIIEGIEAAFMDKDPPIQGSVTRDEVLVEFTTHSIDSGALAREAVRHFRIGPDGMKRIPPLALSPRDFVDEWLTHDWKETALWSESTGRSGARDWHRKLHKDLVSGEFVYPSMHCRVTPDLWQVGVNFGDASAAGTTYFLVRWRPPFQFSMVEVADHPWPRCTEEDRQADDEPRTLFPVQDQR